jgi:hypothetical protein
MLWNRICAFSGSPGGAPVRGVASSSLPPVVVPVVEWRALPAILDPAIAVTLWAGAAPSRSAPAVGSRPTDPDGRTRIRTAEAAGAPSIPATSGAVRTWFGNRLPRTRRTGFSIGCCCGRSISDLKGRCCVPNTWLRGGWRRRRRRVEDVHKGDVARAQMVSLSGLNVAPCRLPLLLQLLLVRDERRTVLFSIVGHLLAVRRSLGGLGGSVVHHRIIIISSVCQCPLIPNHATKLFRAVDIAPKDRDVIVPVASRMFVPEP